MRLVPFLLTAALAGSTLAAQAPGKLPWETAPTVPWMAGDCGPLPETPAVPQGAGPLRVRITSDGTLRLINDRGIILLRLGLPGRPKRGWRGGGAPVTFEAPIRFTRDSLLSKGIGGLPVGAADFRPALAGLLWIVCDDERMITLVHPATARLCYLPLPGGRNFQLVFHPDRLEVRQETGTPGQTEACWAVPWLSLLPQFIQLGQENPANRPTGTALLPFPKS